MNTRVKITIGILFIFSTFSFAGNLVEQVGNPTYNNHSAIIPPDVNDHLDELLDSWVAQRSRKSDCYDGEAPLNIPDSLYQVRLKKMPCIIEMPFNNTIKAFIELYTVRKRTQMQYMLGLSEYYFPLFEQALEANGLPHELKYLPIIESALNTTIVSRAGAAGLWQFMVATGKMYGLEVNTLIDERLDPIKATKAAAHFLKDLYKIYGDWNLVIAAYNCGPGTVNKAIRRAGGVKDYWTIYPFLPLETRGYVPIFIAANYSIYYSKEHNLCKAKVPMPTLADTIMLHERVHFEQISKVLNMPIEQIRLLNPQYRKDIIPGDIKPYSLCLPLNQANNFISKYNDVIQYKTDSLIHNRRNEVEVIKAQTTPVEDNKPKVVYHTVKRGQTLSQIATRYGVSLNSLKKWNHLRSNRIQAGLKLKIMK